MQNELLFYEGQIQNLHLALEWETYPPWSFFGRKIETQRKVAVQVAIFLFSIPPSVTSRVKSLNLVLGHSQASHVLIVRQQGCQFGSSFEPNASLN